MRCYYKIWASHTKTMLPTVMAHVHQVWPKPSCKAPWKGGRRQGRQRKRWEDNIRECTGREFAKSQRAVESREKWRKLVVKSLVVPQQPSRLWDRWDENERSSHIMKCCVVTSADFTEHILVSVLRFIYEGNLCFEENSCSSFFLLWFLFFWYHQCLLMIPEK